MCSFLNPLVCFCMHVQMLAPALFYQSGVLSLHFTLVKTRSRFSRETSLFIYTSLKIEFSKSQSFKLSKFQTLKVSNSQKSQKSQSLKVSKFQSLKVSNSQSLKSLKVSNSQSLKVSKVSKYIIGYRTSFR